MLKKLGLTEAEFDRIMALPPKSIADYPAYENSLALQTYRTAVRVRRRLLAGTGLKRALGLER